MAKDTLILLHGLSKDSEIMQPLADYCSKYFETFNSSYASTQYPIEVLADQVYQAHKHLFDDQERTMFLVGHSLGGIIIRQILHRYSIPNLGRVVMLGTPNKGSEVARFFKRFKYYQEQFGPAGIELGIYPKGILAALPPANYELGVVAGKLSLSDILFSLFLLPGKDDGKVTVESTKLEGMKEHIIVRATHKRMPHNAKVMKQALHFLRHGEFEKSTTQRG